MKTIEQQIAAFREIWDDGSPALTLHTSGSTGVPKEIRVEKAKMQASAVRTCRFLGIPQGVTTLLCMPLDFVAGRMVCVRAWACGLQIVAVPPSLHPLATLDESPYFAAMTPAQVYETLQVPGEARLLRGINVLLIGGGAVGDDLVNALRDMPGAWCTYGMTETLSHIALKHIAAPYFEPLPGVTLGTDERGCLVVSDTCTGVSQMVTNDIVEYRQDGSFRVLGRADNVICSGGLKWQIEDLESQLAALPSRYAVTAVPDERLGEAIVLLYECPPDKVQNAELRTAYGQELREQCQALLPKHALPRYFVPVRKLPKTATGKPDRAEARRLAQLAMELRSHEPTADIDSLHYSQ